MGTIYSTLGAVDSPFLLEGLFSTRWDSIAVSYPDTVTEIYTFKRGGSGGDTVITVTLVYTDATKEFILTVDKT